MMSKLGPVISKVEKNSDLIGAAYAGLGYFKQLADTYYGGDLWAAISDNINVMNMNFTEAMARVKVWEHTDSKEIFKNSVLAAGGGYLLKEFNVHPTMTRVAKAAESVGWSALFTVVLASFMVGLSRPHASPTKPMGNPNYGNPNRNQPFEVAGCY